MNNTEIDKINDINKLEERLIKLEEMLVHIHSHTEYIFQRLVDLDLKLGNAISLFGDYFHIDIKTLEDVEKGEPELIIEELKTPISEEEMVIHKKRLEILNTLNELDVCEDFDKRQELWNKLGQLR